MLPIFSLDGGCRERSLLHDLAGVALVCFVALPVIATVGAGVAALADDDHGVVVVDLDEAMGTGREDLVTVSVADDETAEVSTDTATGIECFNDSEVEIYRVESGATSTTGGLGPYCTTCTLGPRIAVPVRRLFLRASSGGPQDVVCSILDGGAVPSGGGGGGLSSAAADAAYLRLDTSNDPLTGQLELMTTATATPPALSFDGDTNTGITQVTPDTISLVAGGGTRFAVTTTALVGGGLTGSPKIPSLPGTASAPTYSFDLDTDTGMWRSGVDQVSIGVGGNEYFRLSSTAQALLNPKNLPAAGEFSLSLSSSASTPAFSFAGDTDTGIYRSSSDVIGFATGGSLTAALGSNWVSSTSTGSWSQRVAAGTAAAPTYSFTGDTDTGMYRTAADEIGFSAGGNGPVMVIGDCVSIGDASCSTALDVEGTTTTTLLRSGAGADDGTSAGIGFTAAADAGMTYVAADDGLVVGNNSGSTILFAAGAGQDVRLQADNDVSLEPNDDAQVSAGGDITLSSGSGEISFTGNLRGIVASGTGATSVVRMNGVIDAAPTRPACSTSANAGDVAYIDDTNDAEAGQLCICNALANGTYGWRFVSSPTSACAGSGA
jgi:hypothetical protein